MLHSEYKNKENINDSEFKSTNYHNIVFEMISTLKSMIHFVGESIIGSGYLNNILSIFGNNILG